jgi:hypothetical protein
VHAQIRNPLRIARDIGRQLAPERGRLDDHPEPPGALPRLSGRVKILRSLFVLFLALSPAVAGTRPHDFTTGGGTSPGAPGNPNNGQPPTHHGSANGPDAWGDSDPVDLFRGN